MHVETNNIAQFPDPTDNSPILGSDGLPRSIVVITDRENPFKNLRFDSPIHKVISHHLGESNVSPFSSVQMRTKYAGRFYFNFFVGVLTAACLEPSNKISSAYWRTAENQLQILVAYEKNSMYNLHLHIIHMGESISDEGHGVNRFAISDQNCAALCWHIGRASNGIDARFLDNYEYELVPQPTNIEGRTGIRMSLMKSQRVEYTTMTLNFNPDHVKSTNLKIVKVDNRAKKLYANVRRATNEPEIVDLNNFAEYVIAEMNVQPSMRLNLKAARTAGYLHGLLSTALPDEYYQRVLEARFPAVSFNMDEGMQLYFPATVLMPNEHLLLDMNTNKIKNHFGYDVLNQLTNVGPETSILEISENDLAIRMSERIRKRALKWNIVDLAENLRLDILGSSPSEIRRMRPIFEHYSQISNNILNHRNIKCNLRSMDDVKAFLIGALESKSNDAVGISQSRKQLHIKTPRSNDFLITFDGDRDYYHPVGELINGQPGSIFLGMKFKFQNGQISFEPFSMKYDEAMNRFSFTELPKFSLIPSLEEINKISDQPLFVTLDEEVRAREMLHENMHSLFKHINVLSIPEDSVGPFLAGVFHQSQTGHFEASKDNGRWSIQAEMSLDGRNFKFYMDLFRSNIVTAGKKALNLKRNVEKDAFVVSYNLENEEDGLAVLALSGEQKYLNTDTVNALCNTRRKRRAGGVPYCGLNIDEEVSTDDTKNDETSENFKISEDMKMIDTYREKVVVVDDVSAICHYAGQSLMIRDLISDVYHGNKLSALKDVGFLAATAYSPQLGKFFARIGAAKLAEGAYIRGYAAKAFGFGISRAMSLYVLGDFIYNTVKFAQNTNDTAAEQGMIIDGAFLAIDALVLGIQGLGAAGYFTGLTAVAGPVGALIGTALIIGLNVYQAMETVANIEKIVALNGRELIDEYARAILHIDVASNIQELISEEKANEVLKDRATNYLTRQNQYDTFITKAGFVNEKSVVEVKVDAVVDLKYRRAINISRASPKHDEKVNVICPLQEEAKEIQSTTFWSEVEGFFAEIGRSFKTLYHVASKADLDVLVKDAVDEKLDGQIRGNGYICHNSFGLQLKNNTPAKMAYFDLGDGDDVISGFINKPNSFRLGSGRKYINGSEKNDVFMLEHSNITGILNGSAGQDTVDISGMDSNESFTLAGERYGFKNVLTLNNIETVIGRSNIHDTIICGCSFRTVRMLGGSKDRPDVVIVEDQNCPYEMILYLDDNTKATIDQAKGNFTYVINMTQNSEIELVITDSEQSLVTHTLIINDSFLSLKKIVNTMTNGLFISDFTFENDRNLNISRSSNESLITNFKDGCQVRMAKGETAQVFLNSNLSIIKIDQLYGANVRQLGISLVAFSTFDNETMMISANTHEGPSIVQNSLLNPTRLFIENCGNHLILVNANNNDALSFPAIDTHIRNCSCSSLTIDLNLILELLEKLDTRSEYVDLYAGLEGDNLLISVSRHRTSSTLNRRLIGKITVTDAFKNQCYKNIKIRSYNDFSVLDKTFLKRAVESALLNIADLNERGEHYVQGLAQPQSLIYDSNYKFIHLSNLNTEWFNKIIIKAELGQLEFFHSNATSLFITNIRTLDESNSINLCTIHVESFYESKKLWTLTIKAVDSDTRLFDLKEVGAAQSIDKLINFFGSSTKH